MQKAEISQHKASFVRGDLEIGQARYSRQQRNQLIGEAGIAGLRRAAATLWLRVGAALERGAIVVGTAGIGAGGLFLRLLCLGAQGRLAGSVVRDLAREHDVAEARLYGIEFGSGDDVFLPRRKNAGDFLLRVFNALWRGRMR